MKILTINNNTNSTYRELASYQTPFQEFKGLSTVLLLTTISPISERERVLLPRLHLANGGAEKLRTWLVSCGRNDT